MTVTMARPRAGQLWTLVGSIFIQSLLDFAVRTSSFAFKSLLKCIQICSSLPYDVLQSLLG
jgi:hypothetical protein